jgi:hypothetical protein
VTVRELIASSLRLAGVLAANESLDAGMAANALVTFNDLLDTWRTERLTLTSQDRVLEPLVAAQASYTIGTAGNIDRARPLWIDAAGVLTADGLETPITILTRAQRASIGLKGATSDLPSAIFYDPQFPLGVISVYPVPTDSSASLVLYLPAESLDAVADLDVVLSLRPGWSKALRYGLTVDLATEYAMPLDGAILQGAADAKAAIKRTNLVMNDQIVDRALRPYPGQWNYRRGDF